MSQHDFHNILIIQSFYGGDIKGMEAQPVFKENLRTMPEVFEDHCSLVITPIVVDFYRENHTFKP